MKDENTHYMKTVGSCRELTTIKMYDETGGVDPVLLSGSGGEQVDNRPITTVENIYFRNYVTTISQYIFTQINRMNRCLDNHGSPPQVELVFVYRPVISRGIEPFKEVEWTKPKFPTTKHLESPWAKITLDRSPQVKMRAVFIWNERQFLHDEASILAGHALDTKPLMPIDLKTFDRWKDKSDSAKPSQEAILLAQLPADLQWLFKHVRITDKCISEGEVRCGLKTIMEEREKPGYTELSKAMIRKFLASKQNEIRYENVFALKDTFDINQYHIDKYHKMR